MPKWVLGGTVAGVLSAGALLLVGNVQGQARAQQAGFLPYLDKEAVAAGGELYTEYCASCHGASLAGEANWRQRDSEGYLPAPPHDATGHTWHHPDAQLFMTTKFGTEAMVGNGYRSRMMGFEDVLSDREIVQILAFIKSTWPERIIEAHNQRNAAAQNQ
jgi:mono/diheme cytochrome c family protein